MQYACSSLRISETEALSEARSKYVERCAVHKPEESSTSKVIFSATLFFFFFTAYVDAEIIIYICMHSMIIVVVQSVLNSSASCIH